MPKHIIKIPQTSLFIKEFLFDGYLIASPIIRKLPRYHSEEQPVEAAIVDVLRELLKYTKNQDCYEMTINQPQVPYIL